jgi:hypothetical protein
MDLKAHWGPFSTGPQLFLSMALLWMCSASGLAKSPWVALALFGVCGKILTCGVYILTCTLRIAEPQGTLTVPSLLPPGSLCPWIMSIVQNSKPSEPLWKAAATDSPSWLVHCVLRTSMMTELAKEWLQTWQDLHRIPLLWRKFGSFSIHTFLRWLCAFI